MAVWAGRLTSRGLSTPLVRLCMWDDTGHIGIDMGQTVKLRGNPKGQRGRSGVATSHEHHVVAWR
jgi:hypothetical protein